MLITIPHAAIFGPQNSSDGMSVFGLIDQSEPGSISDSLNRETIHRRTVEPHGQLILINRVYSVKVVTRSEATNENVQCNSPALSSEADQWRSTSKVAQHFLYPVYLCWTISIWFSSEYVTYTLTRTDSRYLIGCESSVFFSEIFSRSPWKPANDSELANVRGANFS